MSNEFVPFATDTPGTANSLTPAGWAALTSLRQLGFQSGIALSEQMNTALRQATTAAAAIGKFADDYGPNNALDNGNPADLTLALKAAIDAIIAAVPIWLPGDVKASFASSFPTGWLLCNGAIVSRATYAALFGQIGTMFGAGDGSTTFALPDLRGEFLRGNDLDRGVDPDSPRGLGSSQGHAFASHTHDMGSEAGGGIDANTPINSGGVDETTAGNPTSATGGAETRPRNVSINYFIKF